MSKFPFHPGEATVSFMYIFLPFILSFFHTKLKRKEDKIEIYLLYTIFIGVGIQGLLTGIVQVFKPDTVAYIVNWPSSPFILELGMANLSYGILGVLSILVKKWRTPVALGYGLFLLFTGMGHVIEIFQKGITPGNAQTFLFSDLLVPIYIFILFAMKHLKKSSLFG